MKPFEKLTIKASEEKDEKGFQFIFDKHVKEQELFVLNENNVLI